MKFKQVLLTSTAMLMLGTPVAPLFAQSQQAPIQVAQAAPPALAGAIQTYLEAQAAVTAAQDNGGDVAAAESALAAAEAELGALCSAVGQPDIASCIAAFESGAMTAPAEPEAPVEAEAEASVEAEQPAEEAPAEEAAPVEEAPVEEAPAEEALVEEAPSEEPVAAEEPAAEEPAPAEEAPFEEPAPVEAEAPTEQQPAAEEPAAEEPVAEEPAAEQPVTEEAPAAEEAAPEAPAEEPAPEAEAEGTVEDEGAVEEPAAAESQAPAALTDAVAAYEAAVAEFDAAIAAGGDVQASADAVTAAEAEMAAICEALGQTDLTACLTGFGLDVEIVDVQAALDAGVSPESEMPAEPEAPAEGEAEVEGEAAVEVDDDIMLEGDVQGEIVPEGTDESEVAPLLDSAKDAESGVLEDEAAAGADAETEADVEADADVNAEADAEAEAEAEAPAAEEPAAPVEVDVTNIPSIVEEEAQNRQQISIQDIEQAATASEGATLNEAAGQQQANQQGGVLVGPVREGPSNAEIIATIGLATVFAIGANQFIDTPDTPRIVYPDDREYYYEDLSGGRTREVILRADGSQIVTVRDQYGDIIRRSRIEPDGREILLVYVDPSYTRYDEQGRWIDPGRQLPPLVLNIPPREYVLDASVADQQQVAQFLDQPPVETIQRYYTIDEVKRSARLRDMVRRLEIGDLTFETASANISQSEIDTLSEVANAMLALIEQNPAETFLIEGHTDAVGSDLSNLSLSDRRAEAVAYALTRVYGIPAENLATQGYGERYLKVNTQSDERTNRRVTVRRITPLVTPMTTATAG